MTLAIANRIRSVHAKYCADPRHRYRSWEHCYRHFQEAKNRRADDEEGVRMACLHLGFYLASWGMYRGSSFLLQKDFLVHEPVIRCLFAAKHESLWSCDERILHGDVGIAEDVFALSSEIKSAYDADFRNSDERRWFKLTAELSDTLVTKVMLGTMGCCPAYDRFFNGGAKGTISPIRFGVKSLKSVIGFIVENRKELLGVQKDLERGRNGIRFPLMKLVDMHFWQKGYEEDNAKGDKET